MSVISKLRRESMMRGREGLGGYHPDFSVEVYTELLIKEIVEWSEANGGLASGPDEEGLREYLGI